MITDNTKDAINSVYNSILIQVFQSSELVQHFHIQIWLQLILLFPSTSHYLHDSTLHSFITSTLEISISMSSYNDHDGITKQFFTLLVDHCFNHPPYSVHQVLSYLLHYQGLTSNIPSFLLILLNKQSQSLQPADAQSIFKFDYLFIVQ